MDGILLASGHRFTQNSDHNARPASGSRNVILPKSQSSGSMYVTDHKAVRSSGSMNVKGHTYTRPGSGSMNMNVKGHRVKPTSGFKKMNDNIQEFTANSARTVQLFLPQEASISAPIKNYKPKPPLCGSSSTRHTRPHTKKQNNQNHIPKCFTQIFDADQLIHQKNEDKTGDSVKNTCRRRVQSAKPRLTSQAAFCQNDDTCIFLKAQQSKGKRPVSAVELGNRNKWNYSYTASMKTVSSDNNLCWEETMKAFEPCVYGYKTQSWVSGHSPGVTTDTPPTVHDTSDQLSNNSQSVGLGSGQPKSKTLLEDDNISLSELIDFDDIDDEDEGTEDDNRVPRTLQPLLAWATPQVSQEIIGIDPAKCLIFLPSLKTQLEPLPCVPPPLKQGDELPYKERILPPQQPKKPKKYDHPWTKLPIEEHVCNHTVKRHEGHTAAVSPRQIKVYTTDGQLLHQSWGGPRTKDVLRKEIQELEDLMQGIGTLNGCSIVVQYQAEINRLHNMVNKTMGRVEEIERREEEKRRLAEPPDHFGLREFYRNHDEMMLQLREQHAICVQELATLTDDLEMNTARQHFQDRLTMMDSTTNPMTD